MSTVVQELRSATRIGVRTPVVIYYQNALGKFVRCRAWTDDLSVTGARITAEHPLDGSKLLVRIMLPDLKDQVIIAEIVREIDSSSIPNNLLMDIRRSFYGIRFLGVAEDHVRDLIQELDSRALAKQSN